VASGWGSAESSSLSRLPWPPSPRGGHAPSRMS